MANEEQLSILKQGVEVWNRWRRENPRIQIDLSGADLSGTYLGGANLTRVDLREANLSGTDLTAADLSVADLREVQFSEANLSAAQLRGANLSGADLRKANLSVADLREANLRANLGGADLTRARLNNADLIGADLIGSQFSEAVMGFTIFGHSDLSKAIGLENVFYRGPSSIATDTFTHSNGKIPEVFLRGCGLSDWEIEQVKLYNPDLSSDQFINIQNRIFDLRNGKAIQISPLFISYSHVDREFVDKVGHSLTTKGVRYWRDIHDMKSGRIETQIDLAIRQNPTVLLVLSENSLSSDWVEHEVRTARGLEKEMGRDVLCPVALDDSWKSSAWPKRLMEQIMEYNILDFSAWEDDRKFDGMFRKLIDGLELFYKG